MDVNGARSGNVNPMHDMVSGSFGEAKMDKSLQLNPGMSILNTGIDELTSKLRGGLTNG